jgi:DoxX-like family
MTTSASHVHAGHVFTPVATPRKTASWGGRVLSALPVLMMAFSATMKLMHAPQMVSTWVSRLGWPESTMTPVAIIELSCAIIFVIPRTAVIGAILVASFFGGAFAAHLRIGDPGSGVVPIVLGVLAWVGLYLRDERLRGLVPLRRVPKDTVRLSL